MNNAIDIKNLCKNYKDFSLNNVSFIVPYGSIVGFIGENGAGKTTTLLSILDVITPTSGDINVLGLNPQKRKAEINEQIGVVMENCFFHDGLTAKEIGKIMSGLYKNWSDNSYNSYIEKFALPNNKTIKNYSRGMKIKLMLAAAMSHSPKLLILDEATSGLDPVVRSEMLDIFMEFIQNDKHSILMSSHITSDLEKIADYIVYIHAGKILFAQTKDEILENYAILKCSANELGKLDKKLIRGVLNTKFNCEILVSNRFIAKKALPNALIDNASLDDIMTFISRGNF